MVRQCDSFLRPGLICHVVDVGVVIFVTICIHLVVLTEECPLVESVFVWQIAGLADLILLGVKYVR